MPTYEYRCPQHGKFTEIRRMVERHLPGRCKCGQVAEYCISAPRVFGDFEPYESPASGKWIEGKRQRAEDFARTGTRPYDEGEMKDFQTKQKLADAVEETEIDNTVDQVIGELRSN